MGTDIFVFNSKKERDAWVAGDNDLLIDIGVERIDITAKEAKVLAGKHFTDEPEWDDFQNCRFYRNWSAA